MQTQTRVEVPIRQSIRILLIEEHAEVRHALTQTLMQQLKQTTVWATPYLPTTAEELLEFEPSVILIGMPQQAIASVETLLDQIEVWVNHQIPVITLAAYIDFDEVSKLKETGVFATLLKATNFSETVKTIKMAVHTAALKESSHV